MLNQKWEEPKSAVGFHMWLTALICFIYLTPIDTSFCDLWLQVWVERKTSKVAVPFPYHETEPRRSHSDQLLEEWVILQPVEHEAANGGK